MHEATECRGRWLWQRSKRLPSAVARFVRRASGLDHEEVEGPEGQIGWEDPKRVPPVQIDFASEKIPEDGTSCAGFLESVLACGAPD
jgi:hypothetical protein